ncbi:MAG TPA: RsmG family class I SAM-dependent methyltransferase [Acidimicrobiia bacterium]
MDRAPRAALEALLTDARTRGFVGPGPIGAHITHAEAWAAILAGEPGPFLDLGSGAGLPGLVLALERAQDHATLLDASDRRAAWLAHAVDELDLSGRVEVRRGRAETVGREHGLREGYALVVARSFGSAAETAECATAFARLGGAVSVSEPPAADPTRWPADEVWRLGLVLERTVVHDGATFVILRKRGTLGDQFPRRDGLPHHRPLW